MIDRLRSKLSFANVVSLLALFVAFGGTAYAAGLITSADIKNGAVRSADIKNNGVKSRDLKDGNVTGADVNEPTLSPVCPGNAANNAKGVCFGSQHGAADWDIAARQCATEGLRLPSVGELLLITNVINTGNTYLWTDEAISTPAANSRIIVRTNDAGFTRIASIAKTGPEPYRCVANAR